MIQPETEQFTIKIWQRLSPAFIQVYQEHSSLGTLIFLDTETSGIYRSSDVIEIGAICVEPTSNLSININIFSELILPHENVYISPRVIEIHGITKHELKKYGRPPVETLLRFSEWIKIKSPQYLVAHNAVFDEGMLRQDFLKHKVNYDLPKFKCTVKMARELKKAGLLTAKNAKLVTLSEYFECPQKPTHRSLADAEACAYVFAKMMLLQTDR
jgi:DNA polymerase III epsilon subunit-like protein